MWGRELHPNAREGLPAVADHSGSAEAQGRGDAPPRRSYGEGREVEMWILYGISQVILAILLLALGFSTHPISFIWLVPASLFVGGVGIRIILGELEDYEGF